MGGWPLQTRLINAKKWPKVAVRNYEQNAIASSNYGGVGGGDEYRSKVGREAITIVLVQW